MQKTFPIPEKIASFASIFKKAGHSLYAVGGAVRDWLLGLANSDWDFCTDATPAEMTSLFRRTIPTGIKHGTVTILYKNEKYEVTTFRTEASYSDCRHPDSIRFARTLEEDLSRRDFTVNAFAADCSTGEITDLFGGIEDLKNRTIRSIGNPAERFSEDALRLMRMARFCSKLSFSCDAATKEAASLLHGSIAKISRERVQDELFKTLETRRPSIGLRLMEETGILREILPELSACREIEQIKVGSKNLLDHIYASVDESARIDSPLVVRVAALLHDIGKPEVVERNPFGRLAFPNHAESGAEASKRILRRLKCSNEMTSRVSTLVRHHDTRYRSSWRDGDVKRFIRSLGTENIDDFFRLKWCDEASSVGEVDDRSRKRDEEFKDRIKKALTEPLNVKDLAVNGVDLMNMGIPRDSRLGETLNSLLEIVLDYPVLNDKRVLLDAAETIFQTLKTTEQAQGFEGKPTEPISQEKNTVI